MPSGKPSLDWNGLVLTEVRKQLEDVRRQGIEVTVRGMYYSLVAIGVLPNTQQIYKAFDAQTVKWRERGIIPIDAFEDDTRRISKGFDDEYKSPTDFVKRLTNYLRHAHKHYKIPRWYNQDNYVEIWLEKNAALRNIRSMVKDLDIIIAPNSGNSSVKFFNDNVDRLKEKQDEGKNIYVIYLGDCDPSGEMMPEVYKKKFEKYGISRVNFIPLSVTMEQIDRFNLLTDPDPKTLLKLQNDRNRFKFMEKHDLTKVSDNPDTEYVTKINKVTGKPFQDIYSKVIRLTNEKDKDGNIIARYVKHDPTRLFAVELEAMQTPDVRGYLRSLLRDTIEDLFDNDVYENAQKEKPEPKEMNGLVLTEINKLSKELMDEELEDEEEDDNADQP